MYSLFPVIVCCAVGPNLLLSCCIKPPVILLQQSSCYPAAANPLLLRCSKPPVTPLQQTSCYPAAAKLLLSWCSKLLVIPRPQLWPLEEQRVSCWSWETFAWQCMSIMFVYIVYTDSMCSCLESACSTKTGYTLCLGLYNDSLIKVDLGYWNVSEICNGLVN